MSKISKKFGKKSAKKSAKRQSVPVARTPAARRQAGRTVLVRNQLPVIDVRVQPLYVRMPARLRIPRGASENLYSNLYVDAFEIVQKEWWKDVAPLLARQYLSPAFGTGLVPEAQNDLCSWLGIRDIGDPDRWTAAEKRAWFAFEDAVHDSMKKAERDYHKQIERLIKERVGGAPARGKGRKTVR